jgi:hypothetical protein
MFSFLLDSIAYTFLAYQVYSRMYPQTSDVVGSLTSNELAQATFIEDKINYHKFMRSYYEHLNSSRPQVDNKKLE